MKSTCFSVNKGIGYLRGGGVSLCKALLIFDKIQSHTFKRHCWADNYIREIFTGSKE